MVITIWCFAAQAIISLAFLEGASVCLSAAAAEPAVAVLWALWGLGEHLPLRGWWQRPGPGWLAGTFQTHGHPSEQRIINGASLKFNTGFLNRSGISHQAAVGWQEMAVI